jgi:hypothetical protein
VGKVIDFIKGFFDIKKNMPDDLVPDLDVYDASDDDVRAMIVSDVKVDFEKRIRANQPWHLQWIMNLNFINGNQYCDIFPELNDVIQTIKTNDYQERKAYNMIASIVETRVAQLNMVDYGMKARPVTNDRDDTIRASLNTKVLKSHGRNQKLPELVRRANLWSESTGTAFFVPVWNPQLGKRIDDAWLNGEPLYMGDIETMIGNSFEILPDNPFCEDVSQCRSIIRHKVYSTEEVFDIWGVWVEGCTNSALTMQFKNSLVPSAVYEGANIAFTKTEYENSVVVMELWERPNRYYPDGRLVIVGGNTLLHYGALPFKNGKDGKRCLPIIPVKSIDVPGCFWGKSVVERLIPIQQEYNAVRNRKTEALNKITNMPLAVEQNSVDVDALEESGIGPNTIIEYRRGSQAPRFLEAPEIPQSLIQEEQNLITLFTLVSGVSEMSWRSMIPANATSGPMLQIIRELDNTKLSIAAKNCRSAVKRLAEHWMALSKEYVSIQQAGLIAGDTDAYETFYWDGKDIEYYDLEFETEDELALSPAQRYMMSMDYAKMGLFLNPKTGAMDELARSQLLSTLKIGNWESIAQRTDQQKSKARWNIELIKQGRLNEIAISSIDDNEIAIDEYSGFMLSNEYRKLVEEVPEIGQFMEDYIAQHKAEIQRKAEEEMMKQLSVEVKAQQTMQLANQQFQNVAAQQNATMQNKYANQTAANSQTVPQPSAPDQAAAPQDAMAQMLAQAQ